MHYLRFIFILFLSLAACNTEDPVKDLLGMKSIPLQREITAVQPMTGIVFWTSHDRRNTDAISLEYSYMLYSDIVSRKGEYDWTILEILLDEVASRRHQAIVRFRYVYPGDRESAVPAYIRELPDYDEKLGVSEGQETMFPDWRNGELQRFHLEFYKKFAQRYDDDPRIAFLQIGFGLWAEYHIYDGPFQLGRTFPSKNFQKTFVETMDGAFDRLPWSISIDAASEDYSPFEEDPALKNLSFGLFDDSFMHRNHDGYNTESWNFFGTDRYKTSPAGGEFSYYTEYDQEHALDYPGGLYGRTFEQEAKKFHISYMVGSDQPEYQSMDRIKVAGMASGYRFKITAFRANDHSSEVCVQNIGVAPIYRDAYISVNGVRAAKSLKSLQPGQSECYSIAEGGDQPVLTIECDDLVPGQQIQYLADLPF